MPGRWHDLAVIGAGPAGMAAALAAAQAGRRVALIDAAARIGGQYHRHFDEALPKSLAAVADHPRIHHYPGHRVWTIEPDLTIHATVGEREQRPTQLRAPSLVIAAGAYDRALPFPGWDLPGVLTAGGAQALLKGNAVTAGDRIVLSGTGPFLLPVAAGLAAAGAQIAGVFEANRPSAALLRLTRRPDKLVEGAGYASFMLRHRIPFRTGHAVIAAHGDVAVEAVSVARLDRDWRPIPGTERTIECDTLAIGYGFTPQLELPLQLGCATGLDADGSLVVKVDAAQRTSVPNVYAAGETTGVGGAPLAALEGRLAGRAAAGLETSSTLAGRRRRLQKFAAALHAAYPVREGWAHWLRDDTLVCRCEEVPRSALAEAGEQLGASDSRTVKLLSRAGMGWCQGRVCGYTIACLTGPPAGPAAAEADLRALAKRPLAQPLRLGGLAAGPEETVT